MVYFEHTSQRRLFVSEPLEANTAVKQTESCHGKQLVDSQSYTDVQAYTHRVQLPRIKDAPITRHLSSKYMYSFTKSPDSLEVSALLMKSLSLYQTLGSIPLT